MTRALIFILCLPLSGCYRMGWYDSRNDIRQQCDKQGQFYWDEGVRYKCHREEWKP